MPRQRQRAAGRGGRAQVERRAGGQASGKGAAAPAGWDGGLQQQPSRQNLAPAGGGFPLEAGDRGKGHRLYHRPGADRGHLLRRAPDGDGEWRESFHRRHALF